MILLIPNKGLLRSNATISSRYPKDNGGSVSPELMRIPGVFNWVIILTTPATSQVAVLSPKCKEFVCNVQGRAIFRLFGKCFAKKRAAIY